MILFVRKPTKENFYHGLLLGILSFNDDWIITSNRESGDGFSDIMIRADDRDTGILIEVKYAEDGDEARACRQALSQMTEKNYEAYFKQVGLMKIMNMPSPVTGRPAKSC